MTGKHKQFDKKLHAANDPQSRQVIKEYYLKTHEIVLKDGKNKYDVDLVSEDGKLQIEVEHRLSWKGSEFKYDDINVPSRKLKFFKDGLVDYIILSADYTHIGIIKAKKIQKYMTEEHLKECRNKHFLSGEFFYKIPKTAFKWIKLEL